MADRREARPSIDEESAPLLRDPEREGRDSEYVPAAQHQSFADRVTAAFEEPLTDLAKFLLVLALILLLLTAIFIGLFAGAQHKLNNRPNDSEKPPVTSIVTTTSVATTTDVHTTSVGVPLPAPTSPPNKDQACLDPSCIMLSAEILASLDTSQDPCESFYDYATGGWIKSHPIPGDKGAFGSFDQVSIGNRQVIQRLLEADFPASASIQAGSYDDAIHKKLRGLYTSCMDEDHLNSLGDEPLKKVVDTIKKLYEGNDTIVDASVDAKGLTAALAYVHSLEIPALFELEVEGDVGTDPNFMTLWFSQPSLGLPSKEYYGEPSITSVYQDVIEKLLLITSVTKDDENVTEAVEQASKKVVIQNNEESVWPPWPWPPWDDDDNGGDDDKDKKKPNATERAHKLAKGVLKFETEIAKASLDLDRLYQDPFGTYNPTPMDNITKVLPEINFGDYFATMTPRNFPPTVIVTYPAYLYNLSSILNGTDSDVIEAYLVSRTALTLASNLGTETDGWKAARTLQEKLQGIKKGAVGDRSDTCIHAVENALGFAAGRYFVNETFGELGKEKGTKVIQDIIGAFKKSLINLDWMDDNSTKAATEKADNIYVKVGYPKSPNTMDPRSIDAYYRTVTINNDTFFENMLSASKHDVYQEWQQLGKQRDKEEWHMYPSMVNAYFNPPANEIVFPAGIMQPPFFSPSWPSYMQYGAFGMVAAHELTHAFDSAGRMYNQNGKLEVWWTNETSEAFDEKQQCLSKQYSSYYVVDADGNKVYVNGELTSGENIGDTGLIQAYRAWKDSFKVSYDVDNEFFLPGLQDYTREQLFFIAFARSWAQNIRPAAAVQRVRTDPHSPNRYRVEGTVYNVPEFAEAFNCSAKAKLNPPVEKRCLLW